ncbi:MAG: Bax inhibitor-1/YccA family protein [Bacteroidales bacterium]|nr:Bax inhibitor-1/YccA family protein [Bacteroidales bacterium]
MDTYFNTEERPVNITDFELAEANQRFMVKVYGWMCFALAITGFMSLFVVHFEPLLNFFVSHTGFFIFLLIAEVLLVATLSARVEKMSLFTCTLTFLIYSILNGITLAPLFLVYTSSSIASTFFICAGTFAAMSLFGYFTKQDLTKWGNILIMALVGLIIATLVNLFIHSTWIYWITTYAGVFIFIGLIAYDTQKLKDMSALTLEETEEGRKMTIMGALSLYLDFINLFIYLLRIFGKRN